MKHKIIGIVICMLLIANVSVVLGIPEEGVNTIEKTVSFDNQTELVVQSIIGGGLGKITVNIENNGSIAANDVFIKMIVTGGIFHRVNKSAAWGLISIPEQGVASFAIKHFFGLGKITIVVVARALNAPDVSRTVTAILLGSYIYIAK